MTRPAQLEPCPDGCGRQVFVWHHPGTGITRTVEHTDSPHAPYTLDNGQIRARRLPEVIAAHRGLSDSQRGLPALRAHECPEPQGSLFDGVAG